jgi:hypothetical protein
LRRTFAENRRGVDSWSLPLIGLFIIAGALSLVADGKECIPTLQSWQVRGKDGLRWMRPRSYLRLQGCHQAQGFYLCKPLSSDELSAWYGSTCGATSAKTGSFV